MGNLIPRARVDKTGKTVIRHMREDAPGPVQKRREFAAPTLKGAAPKTPQNPMSKPKKRKVPAGSTLPGLHQKTAAAGTTVEMSDNELYGYLIAGVPASEAYALKSVGIESHEWQFPVQSDGESDQAFLLRSQKLRLEANRIGKRRDKVSDAAHRMWIRDIPADAAAKALDNGLEMGHLTGYLTEEQAVAVLSKVSNTASNRYVITKLCDGNIPLEHFERFGIRELNRWQKSVPFVFDMDPDLIERTRTKAASPMPKLVGGMSEETLLTLVHDKGEEVLDLHLPELVWHEFRLARDGGVYSMEEAKYLDDFIHEVRSRGITDLQEQSAWCGDELKEAYPDSTTAGRDSKYPYNDILDWHNAGIDTDQIIQGLQNRWSREQAVEVFLGGMPSSLAGGML